MILVEGVKHEIERVERYLDDLQKVLAQVEEGEQAGLAVKLTREMLGLTQDELASWTACSRSTICNIERNDVYATKMWLMAVVALEKIAEKSRGEG